MDTGSTAWILASSALVLLMTPGLAFFYGGMTRGKSTLNMMMMSWGALGLVGVLWILWGYSMSFGDDVGHLFGNPFEYFGLKGLMAPLDGEAYLKPIHTETFGTIPVMAFVAFQVVFATITAALISGAIADRVKFSTWMIFVGIWATLVYFPVAHWVFDFSAGDHTGGWIANNLKAIDFAGGTAVHINSGAAGLALALVVGKRKGWPKEPMRPHNLTLVMLGAGLLWFGWFGFNAGSALSAGTTASIVWVNTFVATCAAMLAWLIVERFRDGHATSLGAASGAVAGLVAITPSCSSVSPVGAIILGAIVGVICAFAVGLKYRFGYDDSLDIVGVHMVGGFFGTVLVGFLASGNAPAYTSGFGYGKGLLYGGGAEQLGRQLVGALAVMIFSFVMTFIIGTVLKVTIGWRVPEEDEVTGIDQSQHAETAYDLAGTLGGASHGSGALAAATAPRPTEGAHVS